MLTVQMFLRPIKLKRKRKMIIKTKREAMSIVYFAKILAICNGDLDKMENYTGHNYSEKYFRKLWKEIIQESEEAELYFFIPPLFRKPVKRLTKPWKTYRDKVCVKKQFVKHK